MPDIPNRDELERKIARLLGRFNKTQLDELLGLMGNSPNMNKVPPSFWTESEQALAAELIPFSEIVYLQAAERVVDSVPLPIGFDWTLVNQDAADWSIREVGKLVTEITDTTRKRIGHAVSNYFTEVQTIGDLELALSTMKDRFGNILGPVRAEMISVTEITRAAAQGELAVARQLKNEGIDMRKVWQTNKDDLVCRICEPLQGTEESTWRSVAPDGPPAHVRCRCFLSLLLPKVAA
jgi:hypothetical protein